MDLEGFERIETHISRVYLSGERAYKTKKAVRFGQVDYTTEARRRHFCEEEVRLNRALAPGVYLGVVRVRVGGEELWAVEMERLPADGMLDARLVRGAATAKQIEAVAAVLKEFHAAAPRRPDLGAPDQILGVMRGRIEAAPDRIRKRLAAWQESFVGANRTRLDARRAAGFIREGHGDLHAANVCLVNGRVVIYDRIEFSEAVRCCDVASDIAFLAMDLCRFGRPDLARRLLESYGDAAPRDLATFYQVHRAAVRGSVAKERGDAGATDDYFSLALGYTLPTALVLTCGLPGTGKSTLARRIAMPLRATVLRSDVVRKRLAKMPPTEHWTGGFLEGPYRPEMTERTYAELLDAARAALAAGHSVVVDAMFPSRAWRGRFRALAAEFACPCVVAYVDTAEATVRRRLETRAGSATEVSDAGWAEYLLAKKNFEPPEDALAVAHRTPVLELLAAIPAG